MEHHTEAPSPATGLQPGYRTYPKTAFTSVPQPPGAGGELPGLTLLQRSSASPFRTCRCFSRRRTPITRPTWVATRSRTYPNLAALPSIHPFSFGGSKPTWHQFNVAIGVTAATGTTDLNVMRQHLAARRRARELAVEILNHALRDIPEERVRYHHCWGSMNRPHTTDTPLSEIVPQMLKIKAQAYGSRRPIRATSTSGWSGRTSSCPMARS